MKFCLFATQGPLKGQSIPISVQPLTIGRALENQMVLPDDQVSRKHAEIFWEENEVKLVDHHSTNGVWVNKNKVSEVFLKVGDQIQIGSSVFILRLVAENSDQEFLVGAEEPTSAYELGTHNESALWFQLIKNISQLAHRGLSEEVVLAQLLEYFFQFTSSEFVQIQWSGKDTLSFAHSKQKGRLEDPLELEALLKDRQDDLEKGEKRAGYHIFELQDQGQRRGLFYCQLPNSAQANTVFHEVDFLESYASVCSLVLSTLTSEHRRRRVEEQFNRLQKYVSQEIAESITSEQVSIDRPSLSVEEREVTVLFSDIVGFTPMSEKLSPAEIADLLNSYFQKMVDVISFHKGEVNKFIGDAIMALFGAPKSHGNDACNAIYAGLSMLEALKEFSLQVSEEKRFNMRIGINTGRMVAGNIGSEQRMEYSVLGDEVNLASRLEGVSVPNSITIGENTARLVRDHFEMESLSKIKVKGKSSPISAYRVIGPKNQRTPHRAR